jgi:hypothetical protein
MIANSQSALEKANEMMSFYAQYLPLDYFTDEEDDRSEGSLTFSG